MCLGPGSVLCAVCAPLLGPAPDAVLPGVDRALALFSYEGAGRAVVRRLKFSGHRDALGPLAVLLARRVAANCRPDLVTWVPTTRARRRNRGYDQAELLARAVARSLDVPCRPTLRRVGGAQAGRTRDERAAVALVPTRRVGGIVVVVDDVRTTGSSLVVAAAALRRAGADGVVAATIAATPAVAGSGPSSATLPRIDPLQSG